MEKNVLCLGEREFVEELDRQGKPANSTPNLGHQALQVSCGHPKKRNIANKRVTETATK